MFLLYRISTIIFFPIFSLIIFLRRFINKEDKKRYLEKITFFKKNVTEKNERIWIHAASIGEVNSVLPIIKKINNEYENIFVLLTSSTLSSSQLLKKEMKASEKFRHYFFPIDVKFLVEKFLDNFKPELAIFVDSEVWPNYLFEVSKRKIPLILLNGRITNKTFKRWKFFSNLSKKIFGLYDLCLSSSRESYQNLKELGARNVKFLGNIKFCATVNQKVEKNLESLFFDRNVWCGASTHPGEEKILLNTHKILKKRGLKVVTILIPRHINNSKEIFSISKSLNLNSQIINDEKDILKDSEILIINSIGQMQKYFSLCKNIFMGKSLLERLKKDGGQNPIEPAKFGCTIYHGPYVSNFLEIYDFLNKKGITKKIDDSKSLADELSKNFTKNSDLKINLSELNEYGNKILSLSLSEIMALKK